jgi:hypothetical protein
LGNSIHQVIKYSFLDFTHSASGPSVTQKCGTVILFIFFPLIFLSLSNSDWIIFTYKFIDYSHVTSILLLNLSNEIKLFFGCCLLYLKVPFGSSLYLLFVEMFYFSSRFKSVCSYLLGGIFIIAF